MRTLVLTCLTVAVYVKGEAGYTYPQPSTNYIPQTNDYHSHSGINRDTGNNDYQQTPLIHKHIYVHVAPPEPEVLPRPNVIPAAAGRKHYKIVFIKTPTPQTPSAPVIPAFAQNQEKTLIYVLVKRPEDAPSVSIPTVAPTQPSRPEVYFIRYKTQRESSGQNQPRPQYGPPSTLTDQFGVPSGLGGFSQSTPTGGNRVLDGNRG